jgi:hypothetical protein
MATRNLNLFLAGGLAIGGTALVIVFLTASLRPKEKAPPKLPFANVATLAAGQSITVDTDSLRYFVVYPLDGELYVVAAPIDQGAVMMPDIHWWKPLLNCKDFGLNAAQGAITDKSRFGCRDAEQPEAWVNRWLWDIHGRHAVEGAKIDNMYRVRFKLSGDEVIFTGLEPD